MGESDRERLLADLFRVIIWYSNESNYENDVEKHISMIELDKGSRARAVLRTMTQYDENTVGEVYEGDGE
jgi:hypothetical protein